MYPVLFNLGKITVTPIGVSLLITLIVGLFVAWRFKNVYDLDAEKTLDLFFWTFLGGYLFARIYYVIFHLDQFTSILNVISVFKYPGLSFWGGLIGGYLVLAILSYKNKINFWQIADFALPLIYLGISITSLGCLFNSCQFGLPSNLPIAVTQAGLVEKRFPLQIIESVVFLIGFFILYKKALKFHFSGQVASVGLIWLGVLKVIFEIFRGDTQKFLGVASGFFWGTFLIVFGVYVYYKKSKRAFREDLFEVWIILKTPNKLKLVLLKQIKSWYHLVAKIKVLSPKRIKNWSRNLNIKSTPDQFK